MMEAKIFGACIETLEVEGYKCLAKQMEDAVIRVCNIKNLTVFEMHTKDYLIVKEMAQLCICHRGEDDE